MIRRQYNKINILRRNKSLILPLLLMVAVASTSVLIFSTGIVKADEFDEKIRAVQREIDQYNAEIQKLKDWSNTLEKELAQLSAETQSVQAQINLYRVQHDKLQRQIAENERKIADSKEALGEILSDLYVDGQMSSIEMLASSKNIGEFMDKQTYRSSIRDNLQEAIETIKKAKQELEKQKQEVTRVLAEQNFAKTKLAEKSAERQSILDKTKGDEAAYQTLASDREKQKGDLQRQQQAAIEAAVRRAGNFNFIGDASKGGYPWEAGCWLNANAWSFGGPNGNGTDPLGYGCRQCVSYTAFKVGQRTGNYPRYWGNANMWPGSARSAGYQTGSAPRANSVGVISSGQYGHTVWVEAVNEDGTLIISQYNYYNAGGSGWGHYSKMRVSAGTYDTFIYF